MNIFLILKRNAYIDLKYIKTSKIIFNIKLLNFLFNRIQHFFLFISNKKKLHMIHSIRVNLFFINEHT